MPILLRPPLFHTMQKVLLPLELCYMCLLHICRAVAKRLANILTTYLLAGLLLKRRRALASLKSKTEPQLRDSAALAHVAPGDKQYTKTKATDSDGSQESSESGFKPPAPHPSVNQTSWQLWELVTGSGATTEGRHSCRAFYIMCVTSLVNQGSVPAFIAGDLGSQLISLGPDDANMKHEDIALCRNEQGRPIKLGQGGFGKVSLFTVSPKAQTECNAGAGPLCCCRCTKP